jgi:hypothetical protein
MATGCVLSWVGTPIGEAGSDQQVTFRARTDVVSVTVSVKQGRQPVRDLSGSDFAVTDNGVAQTVDAVSLERMPIDLTLVLTDHRRLVERAGADRDAYLRYLGSASRVRRSLLRHDRLRTVWVDEDIHGGLVGNEESLSPPKTMDPPAIFAGVSTVDGLFYAIAWPVEPDRRHLVVAFTDGYDRFSVLERETLPRLAGHSDAVLHVVFLGAPGDSPGPGGRYYAGGIGSSSPWSGWMLSKWEASNQIVLEAVRRTGGTVHRPTDAERDLAAIIEDYRTSYLLRYTPRGVPARGWHEIGVTVTRPGKFDIRARKGYEVGRD